MLASFLYSLSPSAFAGGFGGPAEVIGTEADGGGLGTLWPSKYAVPTNNVARRRVRE